MNINRNPTYLHPLLQSKLQSILEKINEKLTEGKYAKLISGYRTAAEQFEIYKKGRIFKDGKWVKQKDKSTYTEKDGYLNKSRHNFLPALAFDIGIFKDNDYLGNDNGYTAISLCKDYGFEWGGDWKGLVDKPHIQLSKEQLHNMDPEKAIAVLWQKYLQKDTTYTANIDGIFGTKSKAALLLSTGQTERNIHSWEILLNKHGLIF